MVGYLIIFSNHNSTYFLAIIVCIFKRPRACILILFIDTSNSCLLVSKSQRLNIQVVKEWQIKGTCIHHTTTGLSNTRVPHITECLPLNWQYYRPPVYMHTMCIWDRICENRACGHMILANFFSLSQHITFYPNMLWQCTFQHLVQIYLALWYRLQNENILFQYWDMTFRETGCSLCPHALFSQAQSHICLVFVWCLIAYLGTL